MSHALTRSWTRSWTRSFTRSFTRSLALVILLSFSCWVLFGAACNAPGSVPASQRVSRLLRTDGPVWSADGLAGPVPAPGSCHYGRPGSDPLPDPRCTPGVVSAAVTQEDLASTICRAGYSVSVRPPESLTEPFKRADFSAYGVDAPLQGYELDHLVPLELGGSSDTRNLWPELDDHPAPGVANSKDLVEHALNHLVCRAVEGLSYLPLATAQTLIAKNWTTALARAKDDMDP